MASLDDRLPVLSRACAMELTMDEILLEYVVDHVVEVNKGVTDSDDVYCARVDSSLHEQVHSMPKSSHSTFHHHVSEMWLVLHGKRQLSVD